MHVLCNLQEGASQRHASEHCRAAVAILLSVSADPCEGPPDLLAYRRFEGRVLKSRASSDPRDINLCYARPLIHAGHSRVEIVV